jgi:hypothetical protein
VTAPLVLGVLIRLAGASDPVAHVTVVRNGAAVDLSDAERAQIAERARILMVGCTITSVTEPKIFAGFSLAKEWEKIRAGSHLEVRFPKPVEARRGRVVISEVLIGLDEPNFLGQELSRYEGRVTGHVKCDGHRGLALMCATALRAHLLPGQSAACKVYDRIGEPREPDK